MSTLQDNLSLYLVTEESIPLERLEQIIEEAILGGVTAVQLREKTADGKTFYEKALKIKQLLTNYSIPLFINDRVDIALAVEADGIHIGQDDIPLSVVKKVVPLSMKIGVSVKNVQQALIAEAEGADYIGVGSVFPTATKKDASMLQHGTLKIICQAVTIPAVAIGGITTANLPQILDSGICGAAIVSAIMKADDPRQAAESLKNKLRMARTLTIRNK
ncbi:thiamine phosphate synthase [Peribacillus loiseleuriae]|uniref:Thiamine-phosphate synthase n=1 Tax=Peribacillus loiseleuriae TaxID=1679170 RepID=A0A0K9GXW7_9BACI|nr:thiamine phosphate synthase [Peribacillus loiseleuriae]KMY51483.1 thiamine-phosphate pyrophosphorylase [Peribacillus loiseleuriae]